ncbi:MAG: hypothetical protein IH801_08670 [Nitrospinae bacterium]|nr:hypothetical protein [Nitrospinota bacterium]
MEGSLHSDAKAAGEVLKMLQGLRSSWKVAVGNGSSAKAAGGEVSEEMVDDLKAEIGRAMGQKYDAVAMLDQSLDVDADYI